MDPTMVYNQVELIAFHKIAFAHTLVADNYSYQVNTQGYGIYGKTPKNGGILENRVVNTIDGQPIVTRRYWIDIHTERN